jgi:hypothetical protein
VFLPSARKLASVRNTPAIYRRNVALTWAEGVVNAAVELHDSQVVAVDSIGGAVTVRLVAYVHRSNGRPGIDPGSGWSQRVDLVFSSGVIEERPDEMPFALDDGSISGGATFDGFIPLPTSIGGAVCFEARGMCGERLAIRGMGIVAVAAAEGVFVESFPGVKNAEPGAAADGGGG